MSALPVCKWRGGKVCESNLACSCPMLSVGTCGIAAEFCTKCPYADKDPSPKVAALMAKANQQQAVRRAARAVTERQASAQSAADGTDRLSCSHRGTVPLEVRTCTTCGLGAINHPVFSCNLHGRCSPAKEYHDARDCRQCPDYKPTSAFPIRDLAYYVLPVGGLGVWQRNVAKLLRHWHLFTGRKVVSIAYGTEATCQNDDGTRSNRPIDPPSAVEAMFAGRDVEFIHLHNDPGAWESQAIGPMFGRLESRDPGRAVFFGHAKGVTRPVNDGVTVHKWTDLMYESLLGYWPVVESVLARHPMAGAFKKVGYCFGGSKSSWHYSGSFFWARSADLFGRNWRHHDRFSWAVESWPGLHFKPDEAGAVFHAGKGFNLYSMDYMRVHVLPEWEQWQRDHAHERTAQP